MTTAFTGATVDSVGLRLQRLADSCGLGPVTAREPLRIWALSGVERLHLADGTTVIAKYATGPGTTEATILRQVAAIGVPVPRLVATVRTPDLYMLLEDLGPTTREPDDADAATAAATLHTHNPNPRHLPTDDLHTTAADARKHLRRLRTTGRYDATDDIDAMLAAIEAATPARLTGHTRQPFGLVHGEFHPTSLHIGHHDWHLLDVAKAFTGPGLLDLATWQGTRNPPDPDRLTHQLHTYIAAGGTPDILTSRGGLHPSVWALGWHRVWAAHWYLHQARHHHGDGRPDNDHISVIRRQLTAAVDLLC